MSATWNLKFNQQNLEKVRGLIAKYPTIAKVHVDRAISRILLTVQREATERAPRDTSKLASGWDLKVGGFRGALENTSSYAGYVALGTRPHVVPLSAITPWAERHGVNPVAVQRAIAKKGTQPNPFFDDAVAKGSDVADGEIQRAGDDIFNEIAGTI